MNECVIHKKFENASIRFFNNIAIDSGVQSITYRELNACANRVAHALSQLGVARESVVGFYLDASIEYVIAMLGVLKAGAIFIPINQRFPEKRTISIISKVKPDCFLTNAALEAGFSEIHRKYDLSVYSDHAIIMEDKFNFNVKELPNSNEIAGDKDFQSDDLSLAISPDNGCYIMTTSGSTGEPKAILGTHKGLSHFIDWEVNEFEFTEKVRTSMLSHVTFDVSLRDTFVPLTTGGTLCIPEEDTRQNPRKLVRWLNDKEITLTHIVPTLFRMLIREISDSGGVSNPLPNLKHLLIAGEALYGNDIISWRKANGNHAELVNIYGPTETTLAKFFYRIKDRNFNANEIIPIGRPIPDTKVFIIKDNRHCENGETGEIFIKTPFCSKGYYNDPELTKKSFVQNPLVNDREDIVYQTGDLGKLMGDNNISFVGRLDHQIKLYGNRVEINEIEVVLREHPNIIQAAVAAKKGVYPDFPTRI